MKTTNMS